MVRVTLNITQPQDLALLLQLVQRLGITYTQEPLKTKVGVTDKVKNQIELTAKSLRDKQLALMRQAPNDPLFRSDVEEAMNDFA